MAEATTERNTMYLIDGDELFEIDASEVCEDADGFWVEEDDGFEYLYEPCEIDLADYDLDA